MIRRRAIVVQGDRSTGLLEINMDEAAERFVVIDRRNMQIIHAGVRPQSGIAKILMAINYATANHCLVGIVDDDQVFNAKFLDGVKLQIVDQNTVNMSQ